MRSRVLFFLLFLAVSAFAKAPGTPVSNDEPVVIVTSYNPDVKSISDNVSAFTTRYAERACSNQVVLENLHALNLSESYKWKARLWSMLSKYYEGGRRPAAVVLLGNEAVSTFFSLDNEEIKSTPAVIGMRGDNMIKVIDDRSIDLTNWLPESYLLSKDFQDYNIVGGLLYSYDIPKNISIVEHLPQQVDTLAFISDNTFGGVTMLSYFKSEIEKAGKYPVKYFDGRNYSFSELNYELSTLGDHTAVVIGTWRIDSTDSYALSNTTHTLAYANENLPAVTLASVGLGHWAIGGYSPQYQIQGAELADYVVDYIETGEAKKPRIIPSKYSFDNDKVERFGFDPSSVATDFTLLNQKTSYFTENLGLILAYAFSVILLISLLALTLVSLVKSRRLQRELVSYTEELRLAREKAEKASAMKSQFIANISHEIRTPLNAVLGFSQMLTSPDFELDSAEKKEFGELIMQNSTMLMNLINEILDISRIELNRQKYVISEVEVVKVINTAVASARADLSDDLSIELIPHVDRLVIDTDANKFYQVITNLIGNAKKYTTKGSITIEVNAAPSGDGVQVSVADTGCGVPAEMAESIFETFRQLDDNKQGVGLGLPIVRGILEQLGGKVWLDTSYTGGARFVFVHPRKAKVQQG